MKNTKLVSYYWRRQLWGTGACAPLDFQQLIFFFFTLELYKVFIRIIAVISYVKCFFRILHTTVTEISLFFTYFKKEKGIGFRQMVCMYFVLFHVCDQLFPCRSVPLLAPNPGAATVSYWLKIICNDLTEDWTVITEAKHIRLLQAAGWYSWVTTTRNAALVYCQWILDY